MSGPCYMLRCLIVLLLASTPALAWQVEPGPLCEISHDGDGASVRVTYDRAISEYGIAISRDGGWRDGPVFAIQFDGPRGNTISTDRHVLSGDGATLTVTDSGFGNVLNGLEFNATATALLGDQAVVFSLEGAPPVVRAFRACVDGVSA